MQFECDQTEAEMNFKLLIYFWNHKLLSYLNVFVKILIKSVHTSGNFVFKQKLDIIGTSDLCGK